MEKDEKNIIANGGSLSVPDELDDRVSELSARVEAYKKSLTEIYDLYNQKVEELSLIRRVGDSVREPLDLDTLCRQIVEAVAGEIESDRMALVLPDESGTLRIRASYDVETDEILVFSNEDAPGLHSDTQTAAESFNKGQPAIREASGGQNPIAPGGDDSSLLYLPLVARGDSVGMFVLSRGADQPFSQPDLRILMIISDQAATALANVRLFDELARANVLLRESESQARRTSDYLERLLEAANDVIFTLDEKGRITYVNQRIDQWGYGKDALYGKLFADLMDDGNRAFNGADYPHGWVGRIIEVGLRTIEGRKRNVLLNISSVGTKPEPSYLVLARDVTELKLLEKQLFHSEKLASIGILAAGVAHEIGNPLSAISGYTQILKHGDISGEESREYLEYIEGQTARIQKIIEELLRYSRPSTGHRSAVDLTEALPEFMTMLTNQSAMRHMRVEYDIESDVPPVMIDRDHLAQVIVNISVNAAHAMPDGGTLFISLRREGDGVVIRLADDGPGIPQEDRDRIFDPFFTTKPAGEGTGLGLAICHRIMDNYGGSISLENEPGMGAVFDLKLPAAEI